MLRKMIITLLSCAVSMTIFGNDSDLRFASAESVGLNPGRLEKIDQVIETAIDRGEIPMGAALVARHGKIVYLKYFGSSDVESGAPLRQDTIFRVASMTKAVTSVAAMMLYEEGAYLMNEPIHKYIPAFKDSKVADVDDSGNIVLRAPARPITVRDVLTHQAGMIYQPFLPDGHPLKDLYLEQGVAEIFPFRRDETLESYIDRYASTPMFTDPGGDITYGVATDVVGRLVEVWSGMSLSDFFEKRIFDPLGMTDTSFFLSDGSLKVDRLTTMYDAAPDETFVLRDSLEVDSEWEGPRKLYCGAAGLLSTPTDYFRFAQMILNKGVFNGKRILSPQAIEMMTSNQLKDYLLPDFLRILGDQTGFGMAIRNKRGAWDGLESQGTLSFAGIYWTRYWIDPEEDMIVIAMTQAYTLDQSGFTHKVKNAAFNSILRENGAWPKFKDK